MVIFFSLAGCQNQIDPRDIQPIRPGPDWDSELIDTRWVSDLETVYFACAETIQWNGFSLAYWYDKEKRNGEAHDLGRFSVSADFSEVRFHAWRDYPCGRIEVLTRTVD